MFMCIYIHIHTLYFSVKAPRIQPLGKVGAGRSKNVNLKRFSDLPLLRQIFSSYIFSLVSGRFLLVSCVLPQEKLPIAPAGLSVAAEPSLQALCSTVQPQLLQNEVFKCVQRVSSEGPEFIYRTVGLQSSTQSYCLYPP